MRNKAGFEGERGSVCVCVYVKVRMLNRERGGFCDAVGWGAVGRVDGVGMGMDEWMEILRCTLRCARCSCFVYLFYPI